VALIADLHANLPALEAVLAHARQEAAEVIWNLGDCVGYGAFPEEVVQYLRKQAMVSRSGAERTVSAQGRYDRQVVRFSKRKEKWQRSKEREEYLALEWAYEQLSGKSRKYLSFLSREIRMVVKGKRALLTHDLPVHRSADLADDEGSVSTGAPYGSWGDPQGPGGTFQRSGHPPASDAPDEQLAQVAREARAELILCGCSHRPFSRSVNGVWFINPGSAGLPIDGDPRAAYAILEVSRAETEVFPHRVPYDIDCLVAELERHRLPRAFARMFREARPLDAILEAEAG
jgi:predicted phosphodiesterase